MLPLRYTAARGPGRVCWENRGGYRPRCICASWVSSPCLGPDSLHPLVGAPLSVPSPWAAAAVSLSKRSSSQLWQRLNLPAGPTVRDAGLIGLERSPRRTFLFS